MFLLNDRFEEIDERSDKFALLAFTGDHIRRLIPQSTQFNQTQIRLASRIIRSSRSPTSRVQRSIVTLPSDHRARVLVEHVGRVVRTRRLLPIAPMSLAFEKMFDGRAHFLPMRLSLGEQSIALVCHQLYPNRLLVVETVGSAGNFNNHEGDDVREARLARQPLERDQQLDEHVASKLTVVQLQLE